MAHIENHFSFHTKVFIGLGSNLGDRENFLEKAALAFDSGPSGILNKSGIYETAPWGLKDQPEFLNRVLEISWEGSPGELLELCHHTENKLGRIREIKWGPRTIDIDILLFGDQVINETGLAIPHPGIRERAFVLGPLAEIAPSVKIPGIGKTVMELFDELSDLEKKLIRLWKQT